MGSSECHDSTIFYHCVFRGPYLWGRSRMTLLGIHYMNKNEVYQMTHVNSTKRKSRKSIFSKFYLQCQSNPSRVAQEFTTSTADMQHLSKTFKNEIGWMTHLQSHQTRGGKPPATLFGTDTSGGNRDNSQVY